MAISSAGVGAGIDAESIISKLVAVERQPITLLTARQTGVKEQLSAYGRILSAVESLRTAAGKLDSSFDFQTYAATVANTDYATASTTTGASPGTYTLRVEKLAQANKLQSAVAPSVGAGNLTISLGTLSGGGTVFTPASSVNIAFTGSTLEDLRTAINGASAGVTATIVNGDAGKQLILTSNATGEANTIKLEGDGLLNGGFDYDPTAPTASFTEKAAAQDAEAYIDGVLVTGSSNTLENALTGVSVVLKKVHGVGESTTLTVAADETAMLNRAKDFTKAWNDLNSLFKSLTKYDSTNKKSATLTGDQSIRGMESQLRNVLFSSPGGVGADYPRLADLGITLAEDGSLKLDETKFNTAVKTNLADVTATVVAFGAAFKSATDGLVASTGPITAKTESLNALVKLMDERKEALERKVSAIEKRYRAQFTALDGLVGRLQTQSSYLSQQLARL